MDRAHRCLNDSSIDTDFEGTYDDKNSVIILEYTESHIRLRETHTSIIVLVSHCEAHCEVIQSHMTLKSVLIFRDITSEILREINVLTG